MLINEKENINSSLNDIKDKWVVVDRDILQCEYTLEEKDRFKREVKLNINKVEKILPKISSEIPDDAPLRLKSGRLKLVKVGFLKNLFNKNRYSDEIFDAKRKFNIPNSKDVTKNTLKQSVNDNKADIVKFNTIIEKNEFKLKLLEEKLSSLNNEKKLTNQKIKVIDDKITSAFDLKSEEIRLINNQLNKNSSKIGELTNERNLILASKQKMLTDFGTIYQSNTGCKALNNAARSVYQGGFSIPTEQLNASKVVREYKKAFGDDFRKSDWDDIKRHIDATCIKLNENLSESIKNAAENIYAPGGKNIKTFRGQGITEKGLAKIKAAYEDALNQKALPMFKASQFFSTSLNENVAKRFSRAASNERAIMFVIDGNSSSDVPVMHDLQFKNDEKEKLYSPVACFVVTKMTENTIHLKEIDRQDNISSLPY